MLNRVATPKAILRGGAGVVSLLVTVLASTAAQADVLYSVDVRRDQLVKVDSTTGAVTDVGSGLGVNLIWEGDMTYLNGSLWIVDYDYVSQSFLHQVSPVTGAVTNSFVLTRPNGSSSPTCEGVAAANGQLIAAYYTAGPGQSYSDTLGIVNTANGVITSETSFTSVNPQADFDSLAADAGGNLFHFDASPTTQHTFIASSILPVSYTPIATYQPGRYIEDLVFSQFGLFAIDDVLGTITQHDPSDGSIIATVSYTTGYALIGLAVPAPGAALVFGAAGLCAGRRNRR